MKKLGKILFLTLSVPKLLKRSQNDPSSKISRNFPQMMQFLGIKEDILAKIKTIPPDIKICYAKKGKNRPFLTASRRKGHDSGEKFEWNHSKSINFAKTKIVAKSDIRNQTRKGWRSPFIIQLDYTVVRVSAKSDLKQDTLDYFYFQ